MAQSDPITKYRLTEHAKEELDRHQISETDVAKVLSAPEQTVTGAKAAKFINLELNRVNRLKRIYFGFL